MEFNGIRRIFSTKDDMQYEAIGAFWDELSAKYGRENLCGLGYNWTGQTIDYILGLSNGACVDGQDTSVQLPDEGWNRVTGKTEQLSAIYEAIYQRGHLKYEIERFDDNGNCEIEFYRALPVQDEQPNEQGKEQR